MTNFQVGIRYMYALWSWNLFIVLLKSDATQITSEKALMLFSLFAASRLAD